MKQVVIFVIGAVFGAAGMWWSYQPPASVAGTARVIDGDTLVVGKWHVRLAGIDAPELDAGCHARKHLPPCSEPAADTLRRWVDGAHVRCDVFGVDRHKRLVGVCFDGGAQARELNLAMVRTCLVGSPPEKKHRESRYEAEMCNKSQ